MTQNDNVSGYRVGSLWVDIVLILFLAISLAGNVVLGWKVKSLLALVPPTEAHVGMPISDLKVKTLSGQMSSVPLSAGRATLLYIFKPNCRWCAANLDNIRSLSSQGAAEEQFIGLATTDENLDAYLQKSPLPFPVYVIDDPAQLVKLDFIGTPQTVEISPMGKVLHNWVGAYTPEIAASIESRFSAKLPGLISQNK
jgi:hypothetical protein